ncbi:hypothetical protein BofuT4_uP084240.1 [Botrytis cinerea T4]|uniref:Uncharacterized protein n=1 Tax=Botryotinia fuckeliana (strain T4) TaxID=999810 RepID=G2YJI3_BOTF4|nr:hypothetical protein BofuT4_uP084240.1 [Botrytis cinerea T4]
MVGNLIRGCYESNAALLNLHHQFATQRYQIYFLSMV